MEPYDDKDSDLYEGTNRNPERPCSWILLGILAFIGIGIFVIAYLAH